MPKLIIDQAALELIANRVRGRPIFMGPDGDMLAPGVVDLLEPTDGPPRWQPNDERTKTLVLAGEACRDVLFYLDGFIDSTTRRRAMRGMTVAICKLMDVVVALMSKMNDESSREVRQGWPIADRTTYDATGRRLKKIRQRGPVRQVRNKLGAHLDADIFETEPVGLEQEDVLGAFGDSIVLLMLSMNYPSRWFSWIRGLGVSPDGTRRAVETMYEYPLCVRWITDLDGHVTDMGPAMLAEDPRREVQAQTLEAAYCYNQMVHETRTRLPLITMTQKSESPITGSGATSSEDAPTEMLLMPESLDTEERPA